MDFFLGDIRSNKPWWLVETDHYLIFFDEAAKSAFKQDLFARQAEKRLCDLAALMGIEKGRESGTYFDGGRVCYFVHDRAHCGWGSLENGMLNVMAGARTWFYRHEESHVFSSCVFGSMPPLLEEGFASFVESTRTSRNHRVSLYAVNNDCCPPIRDMIDAESFWSVYPIYARFAYNLAGSFIECLFDRLGKRKFVLLARSCSPRHSKRKLLKIFKDIVGENIVTLESGWKDFLFRNEKRLRLRSEIVRGPQKENVWARESVEIILNNKESVKTKKQNG